MIRNPKLGVRLSGFLIHVAMDMGSGGWDGVHLGGIGVQVECNGLGFNWNPFGSNEKL